MNYKLAIVGSPEAVAGFALLGAETVPALNSQEAIDALLRLKRETQTDEHGGEKPAYAIVFVTEDLASGMSPEDEKKLARGALPAIVPLPDHRAAEDDTKTERYGLQHLRRIVERAVGTDILQ